MSRMRSLSDSLKVQYASNPPRSLWGAIQMGLDVFLGQTDGPELGVVELTIQFIPAKV